MHFTAKHLVAEFDAQFPDDYDKILKMKGIGDYTAAAIASFAFGKAHPTIDGNVIRVITRLFGIDLPVDEGHTKKLIREKLLSVFDKKRPDTFNQAIMEFGALHCTPANPSCDSCPFSEKCVAFLTGKVDSIPLKKKKVKVRDRYLHYVVITNGKKIVLRKRNETDIWGNMYDFPMYESDIQKDESLNERLQGILEEAGIRYTKKGNSDWKKHLLSHQRIHARFHEFEAEEGEIKLKEDWTLTNLENLHAFPLPKLIESYLNGR